MHLLLLALEPDKEPELRLSSGDVPNERKDTEEVPSLPEAFRLPFDMDYFVDLPDNPVENLPQ